MTVSNSNKRNIIAGIAFVFVGSLLLLNTLSYLDLWDQLDKLWPLALIIIGLVIIFGHNRKSDHKKAEIARKSTQSGVSGLFGDIRVAGLTEHIGTIDRSLLLGDIVIDLTGSKLHDKDNYVNASVILGDINIFVPSEFPVSIDLSCCAGSVALNQKKSDGLFPKIRHVNEDFKNASARLYVIGRTIFGDIKVQSISK